MAEWFADTYLTSDHCAAARDAFGIPTGNTIIHLRRNISDSWRTIVDTENDYQAWPFFTYLTHNPDGYPGLGRMVVRDLFREHPRNNDTSLHVLEQLTAPVSVQTIWGATGRAWPISISDTPRRRPRSSTIAGVWTSTI